MLRMDRGLLCHDACVRACMRACMSMCQRVTRRSCPFGAGQVDEITTCLQHITPSSQNMTEADGMAASETIFHDNTVTIVPDQSLCKY